MKKFVKSFLIFILICCFIPTCAYAADKTYNLVELGMSIDIPSDHIVFTRNMNEDDPNLDAYGLTKDGFLSLMTERSIYLNAWDVDVNYEIIVTMVDSPLEDFSQQSDTTLTTLAASLGPEYKNAGITLTDYEIYQHSQTKFIKLHISQSNNGSTVYGVQYHTVCDGKAINITMQSYAGKVSSANETILRDIVDSARFDAATLTLDNPTQTAAFSYTDTDSGMTFTVPANWVQTPMHEEREFIDAKFSSNLEEGLCIIFASEDVYGSEELMSELTEAERKQISRRDIDNSIFSKADIAEMYRCSEGDVSMVSYGGKEYFFAETKQTTTAYGLTLTLPVTYLLRCENGYMYMFQFMGTKDNEYYNDFKSLVSSAVYPTVESDWDIWDQFSLGNLLLSLMVTIAIYSLPIFIYRYAVKKEPVERRKAKKITIIYGICAVIVMIVLMSAINGSGTIGGAIFLWSWVNYRVLIGGKVRKKRATSTHQNYNANIQNQLTELQNEEPIITEAAKMENEDVLTNEIVISELNPEFAEESDETIPQISFCHKCGTKIIDGSLFCHRCGTKIYRETKD